MSDFDTLFTLVVYSAVEQRWEQVWCFDHSYRPMTPIEAFVLLQKMIDRRPDCTYELREWVPFHA